MATKAKKGRSIVLEGFSKFLLFEDGKVFPIESHDEATGQYKLGKEVKASKEGTVSLTSDAGEVTVYNVTDLKAVFPAEDAPGATEETDEPAAEEELDPIKEEHKRLKGELAKAQKTLMTAKKADVMTAYEQVEAAEKALADFKEANKDAIASSSKRTSKADAEPPSAEQIAAQEVYDDKKIAFDAAKKELDAAAEELRKYKKVRTGGNGNPEDHAPKFSYEDAQGVRKMISEGKSNKEIMEAYGNSASSINYIRYYLQHKLKKAPADVDMTDEKNILLYTEFTPMINKYYPNGAPFLEDAIKETNERYKVKDDSVKEAYKTK